MKLNAYLTFDGCCEAAFKTYAQLFGGEIAALLRFADTPACEHVPADVRDKVMHAMLVIDGHVLMGSDACPPEHPYTGVTGASVAAHPESPADAERLFTALSAGGTIVMPLAPTFWAARFGMLVDRFGVPWMINCDLGAAHSIHGAEDLVAASI